MRAIIIVLLRHCVLAPQKIYSMTWSAVGIIRRRSSLVKVLGRVD